MATFYRNKNYSGFSQNYSSTITNLGGNNSLFSSVKITGNQYIIAYDGINFSGNQLVITDDIFDLDVVGFDNKIRSLKFFSLPTPSLVYSKSFDACCSFNAISSNGDIYSCSGFFVTPTGYLVTAAHCVLSDVFNATTQRYDPFILFTVAVSNVNGVSGVHKVFPANLVGYDAISDIAVLKIDGLTTQQYLSWGKSRQTVIGSKVFCLGNPAGVDEDSFSSGIVRDNKYNGEFPIFYTESVLTDVTIIGGNSGGPLLNIIGQVIGLSNYGLGDSNQLGGGVSQYIAETIVNRIIQYDVAGRPVRTDYNANNASLTIPANYPYILNDGSHINGALGCILFQIPKWYVYLYSLPNDLYKGALVYDVDPASDLANYISADDILISIDGQDIGLFKNQITPHSVLINKLPTNTVSIQYYKNSDNYTTLYTQSIILARYPNDANFDTAFMSSKSILEKLDSKKKKI